MPSSCSSSRGLHDSRAINYSRAGMHAQSVCMAEGGTYTYFQRELECNRNYLDSRKRKVPNFCLPAGVTHLPYIVDVIRDVTRFPFRRNPTPSRAFETLVLYPRAREMHTIQLPGRRLDTVSNSCLFRGFLIHFVLTTNMYYVVHCRIYPSVTFIGRLSVVCWPAPAAQLDPQDCLAAYSAAAAFVLIRSI